MQASQERFGPSPRVLCLSQYEDLPNVFKMSSDEVPHVVVQVVRSPGITLGKDEAVSLNSYTEGWGETENSDENSSATLSETQFLLRRISGKL